MLKKIGKILYKKKYMLAAFFVPFCVLLVIFTDEGFFPFGDNQIAVIDMYHQYVPFLSELQYKLQNGGSFLYSWNGGGGTNFISLLAYYAASPLNLILAVFPQSLLMEGVTLIVLLKVGLAGLTMSIYLKHMFRREDCVTVAFSSLYALCAYVLGYYWCLMWLDAIYLLPLCILGLNRLLDRGDFKLYIITIALLLYTNYYIGGMVCIFILCYFPVLYFLKKRNLGVKGCLKKIGEAVGSSLLGIMMAAFLLVPTFLSLQNTYYIDSEMPQEITTYRPILDILTNLLPQMEVTTRTGAPNIYCGLFCVMLLGFYLICRKISTRKKLLNCIMLAFLILSLNVNVLDYMWHGFHFPNQIPFRYSFVVSFLIVNLAYEAFQHIEGITPKQIAAIAALGTAYVLLAEKLYQGDLKVSFAYVTLLLLFMYSGFLAMYRTGLYDRKLMKVLLLTMVIFELTVSTSAGVQTVSHTSRAEYFDGYEDIKTAISKVREEDDDFYRMEIADSQTLNAPMLYNYPGVSQFSSTVNASVTNFMVGIGLEGGGPKNRYNYVAADPVTNAILGIKYLTTYGQSMANEPFWEIAEESEAAKVYRNQYALAMGYMAEPSVLHTWDYQQKNPFHVLNDFVKLATDGEKAVYEDVKNPTVRGAGVDAGSWQNGYIPCVAREDAESTVVKISYKIPKTQQIYVYVDTDDAESIYAQRSDGNIVYLPTDCGGITSVGKMEKGDQLEITVEYEAGKAADIDSYVAGLNEAMWSCAYENLNDETMQIQEHGDTHIKGKITAKTAGTCILSIPYEKGWTVKVDGVKCEPQLLGDAFIAVSLEEGQHTIELSYLPDGLILGSVLSLCSIVIFFILCIRKRHSC